MMENKKSRRMRRISIVLLTCAALFAVVFGAALAGQKRQKLHDQKRNAFRIQMEMGLGREVRLGVNPNSPDGFKDSTESVARFIENRSGLRLSEDLKNKLADLEGRTLTEKNRRLRTEELVEIMTATAVERFSTLTDEEINRMMVALGEDDHVVLRSSGRGRVPASVFTSRLEAMRELSRQKDDVLRDDIRLAIDDEVNSRLQVLEETLPKHWGRIHDRGLTPLQALIVAYSAVSDDSMANSQRTLDVTQNLLQRKMKGTGYKQGRRPGKAFGSEGYLFSTPLDIVLNDATLDGLLDRIAERGAK